MVRVSVDSNGAQSDGESSNDIGSISADGRFVTFNSLATNLVANDGNAVMDVFVHDRDADADGIFDETEPGGRATVRLSVDANGLDANGPSGAPNDSYRKQSLPVAQSVSLKKFHGEPSTVLPSPFQSVLGATWPWLGSSMMMSLPLLVTPPVVVVTTFWNGNAWISAAVPGTVGLVCMVGLVGVPLYAEAVARAQFRGHLVGVRHVELDVIDPVYVHGSTS